MENNSQAQGTTALNLGLGMVHPSVMTLRIDTKAVLEELEVFLKGKRTIFLPDASGRSVIERTIIFGKQMMNDEGIGAVMSFMNTQINSLTVQGNFDQKRYRDFILEFDLNLSSNIMTNLKNWGCNRYDYNQICDTIVGMAQTFFSRLIDNKERESYGVTSKTVENITQAQGRGGLFGIG